MPFSVNGGDAKIKRFHSCLSVSILKNRCDLEWDPLSIAGGVLFRQMNHGELVTDLLYDRASDRPLTSAIPEGTPERPLVLREDH